MIEQCVPQSIVIVASTVFFVLAERAFDEDSVERGTLAVAVDLERATIVALNSLLIWGGFYRGFGL